MPQVNQSADEYLQRWMVGIQQQVGALQSQQGTIVVDSELRTRVQVGLLANGDYGILLVDPSTGEQTEMLPVYESNILTEESTSSTTYTDLATPGPSVTATIGQNGVARVTVNSFIGVPGASGGGQSAGIVGVSIDGNAPAGGLAPILYCSVSANGTGTIVGIASNQSSSWTVTGLSAGEHTFKMVYQIVGPSFGPVNFGSRYIQVRPG